jgi:hypothetical protein
MGEEFLQIERTQYRRWGFWGAIFPTLSGQSTFAVSLPRINFGFKSGEYTHHSKGIRSFEWRIVLASFNGVLPRPLCKS